MVEKLSRWKRAGNSWRWSYGMDHGWPTKWLLQLRRWRLGHHRLPLQVFAVAPSHSLPCAQPQARPCVNLQLKRLESEKNPPSTLRLPPNEARNPYILKPCFWGLTLDRMSTFNALKTQPRSTYQEHFNNQIQKPHATSTNNKTIQQEAN